MDVGQYLLELEVEDGEVALVELHVELDVAALEEQVAQQPVAGVFVEALQQAGADGHDALEVLDFEGKGGDDAV